VIGAVYRCKKHTLGLVCTVCIFNVIDVTSCCCCCCCGLSLVIPSHYVDSVADRTGGNFITGRGIKSLRGPVSCRVCLKMPLLTELNIKPRISELRRLTKHSHFSIFFYILASARGLMAHWLCDNSLTVIHSKLAVSQHMHCTLLCLKTWID